MGLAKYHRGQHQEVIDLLEADDTDKDETGCAMCADYERANALYLIGLCYKLLGNSEKTELYFDEVQNWPIPVIPPPSSHRMAAEKSCRKAASGPSRPDREGMEDGGFFEEDEKEDEDGLDEDEHHDDDDDEK